jgi:RimJ/RimL family protein N-acetyltransferase
VAEELGGLTQHSEFALAFRLAGRSVWSLGDTQYRRDGRDSSKLTRLRLRQWRETDRKPFASLNADRAVMEFFPSLQNRATSDARASIDSWQSQFASQGWSNWAVELRSSGQFIGFTVLTVPRRVLPFSPCVEVGWRLAREHWGRGYATEAARATLRVGFQQFALGSVHEFLIKMKADTV